MFARVARSGITQCSLHIGDEIIIGQDLAEGLLPPFPGCVRPVRDRGDLGDQIFGPMLSQFASPQIHGPVGTVEQIGVAVQVLGGDRDLGLRPGQVDHGLNFSLLLALQGPQEHRLPLVVVLVSGPLPWPGSVPSPWPSPDSALLVRLPSVRQSNTSQCPGPACSTAACAQTVSARRIALPNSVRLIGTSPSWSSAWAMGFLGGSCLPFFPGSGGRQSGS